MSKQKQSNQTFGSWAYIAIAKHYHKSIKYEEKVLKDRNSEHLHQMRVGMRRLRSAIYGFAPALDLPDTVTIKKIGKIAKVLGKLRDIDVLQETLITQYQPCLTDGEQQKLKIVLKGLKKKRKSAFKAVVDILESKTYLKLKNDCQSWLDEPTYQSVAAINIQQVLPDLLLPQISYFLLHPAWLIGLKISDGSIDFSDVNKINFEKDISLTQDKILHDLRKVAKKTRYNMDLFQNLYGSGYSNYLEEIENIQAILGVIQDCFILENFLDDVLKQDLQEAMPTISQILKENRQEQWQKWQAKQEYFLNSSQQQDLRTVVQYPG